MDDQSLGGKDTLSATGDGNQPYGDAGFLFGEARGGNDTLTVKSAGGEHNELYGDALQMLGAALGGNDVLVGGAGNDLIVGDAAQMLAFFGPAPQGGNDQL